MKVCRGATSLERWLEVKENEEKIERREENINVQVLCEKGPLANSHPKVRYLGNEG